MVNFVEPEIKRIAETDTAVFDEMVVSYFPEPAEDLIEFAGRACYQSFHRPNPATADTRDYIRNIIKQGHFSVLEHASVTYYITGVSRAFTHELIRHRHLSFSQMSQRYVDESDLNLVLPPAIQDNHLEPDEYHAEASYLYPYAETANRLEAYGLTRKQAREAARAYLPNMTETRIVVTGNLRAWREFLQKRLSPAADAEMQKVARMIHEDLLYYAPSVFEDLEEVQEQSNSTTGQEQEPPLELLNSLVDYLSTHINQENATS